MVINTEALLYTTVQLGVTMPLVYGVMKQNERMTHDLIKKGKGKKYKRPKKVNYFSYPPMPKSGKKPKKQSMWY